MSLGRGTRADGEFEVEMASITLKFTIINTNPRFHQDQVNIHFWGGTFTDYFLK